MSAQDVLVSSLLISPQIGGLERWCDNRGCAGRDTDTAALMSILSAQ